MATDRLSYPDPVGNAAAANADRWTTRASRMRAHIWITPHGLEYRS